MSFFRKTKPSIDALLHYRGIFSKIAAPKAPSIRQSKESIFPWYSFSSPFSTASSRVISIGRRKQPNTDWRRFYYVDGNQVQHFRRRGHQRWYKIPRNVFLVVIVGGGALVTIYYGNLESVPYSNRKHFVILSRDMERKLGEAQFEQLKEALKGKILPAIHPDSIRVRLISKDIIGALQRGLRHDERHWSDLEYASEIPAGYFGPEQSRNTLLALSGEGKKVLGEGKWSREDEVIDDKWVHETRKKGRARGSPPATQHLEGLNWEVLVVRDNMVNAFCLPGGKIVVFTGLLDHFRADDEVATVIGHEVAHAIARHVAEQITKNLWLALLQLILLQFFFMPDLINAMSTILLKLPFSRRMEMEADYIGLLLMASAGYDPRVAPKVYEKMGQITGDSTLKDYLSTHPSSKKRAQMLSQAQVMNEALALYREAIIGRSVEGFL